MPITPQQAQRSKAGIGAESKGNTKGSAGNPNTYLVTASWYTGSGGGSCGTLQKIDQNTGKQQLSYAELSSNTPSASGAGDNFNAMGDLPCGTPLEIGYNGKSVVAYKADVGGGGAGLSGHPRVIDLYQNTAKALGFTGLGLVHIRRLDGQPIGGVVGKPVSLKGNPFADLSATGRNPIAAGTHDASQALSSLDFLQELFSGALWLTVAKVIGGGILVLVGIIFLLKGSDSVAQTAGKLAPAMAA